MKNKSNFFSRLSYSFGNEDCFTEHEALQIRPQNRVVCITASGDRPLHLLLQDCKEVVAVDANPVQNYLFDLKRTALKSLDPNDYLSFLGAKPSPSRTKTLRMILPYLNKESAGFWQSQEKMIHKGVIYEGAMEKWARNASYLLRVMRRKEIKRLFSHSSLPEQRDYLSRQWNHQLWQNCLSFAVSPWLVRMLFNDPGLICFDSEVKPGVYLYNRIKTSLDKYLARENPLISLIMIGKVLPEGMPPYLCLDNFEIIKNRLNRITMRTDDIISFLESSPENSFDRFSLSDVASYLNYESFLRLLKAMFRSARPGARFCLRQFMTRYKIPEGLKPYFSREPQLEKKLSEEDRNFVYDFTVGKVLKN